MSNPKVQMKSKVQMTNYNLEKRTVEFAKRENLLISQFDIYLKFASLR
jgi:hypothetical protein